MATLFTTCGAAVPVLVPKPPAAGERSGDGVAADGERRGRERSLTACVDGDIEARTVAPSANVTEPDGVPPEEVTVAVKVTDVPKFDGFGAEVTLVEVVKLTGLIVCVSVLAVLFCHPVEPVKLAPMVWLPVDERRSS